MESQSLGSQALAFTVEFSTDTDYESWSPFNPATDTYRHVIATLKVGNVPVYQTDWMTNVSLPMEQQLNDAAAELLTRMWGIKEEWNGERTVIHLPKHEYGKD